MRQELKEQETLKYLKNIVQVYEEIASIRMRRVKGSVLQNRAYLEGLMEVFYQVKYSYNREYKALIKKKDKEKGIDAIRSTNGRTVTVLLTANTGLYGDIIVKTLEKFLADTVEYDTDLVVVGRIGRQLVEPLALERNMKYFDLSDSSEDQTNLRDILEYILNYDKIVVHHGQFKDILFQEPKQTSISGDVLSDTPQDAVTDAKYIFEPTLNDVMTYFEKEILGTIFEHTVHESNLSKYASRMISLDRATERIDRKIKADKLHAQKLAHKTLNNKQIGTLAGIYRRVIRA